MTVADDDATMIDVKDPKYQVNRDFPPDKESTWPYPADKDGWYHSHNALRWELENFRKAFEAIRQRQLKQRRDHAHEQSHDVLGGQTSPTTSRTSEAMATAAAANGHHSNDVPLLLPWELRAIKSAMALHFEHIHAHHSNEDNLFTPYYITRFHYPENLEENHRELETRLDSIQSHVDGLTLYSNINAILQEWTDYEIFMLPHLRQEENECLRLMRAYFTWKEISAFVPVVMGGGPKQEMGSFINAMGVDRFRNEFMPQEHIPFFVWYIEFASKYYFFRDNVVKPLQALKEGKEELLPQPTIATNTMIAASVAAAAAVIGFTALRLSKR